MCEFWHYVSFKELDYLIYVVKFVGKKLLTVFLYCLFNVLRVNGDVLSLISEILLIPVILLTHFAFSSF